MSPGGDDRAQQPASPYADAPPLPTGGPSREPELDASGQPYTFSTPTAPAPAPPAQAARRMSGGVLAARVAGLALLVIASLLTLISAVNLVLNLVGEGDRWGYDVGYALGPFILALPLFLVAWLILRFVGRRR